MTNDVDATFNNAASASSVGNDSASPSPAVVRDLPEYTPSDSVTDGGGNDTEHDDADGSSSSYLLVNGHDHQVHDPAFNLDGAPAAVQTVESVNELIQSDQVSVVVEEGQGEEAVIVDNNNNVQETGAAVETAVPVDGSASHCHDVEPDGTVVVTEQSNSNCHVDDPNESMVAKGQSDSQRQDIDYNEIMVAAEQSVLPCLAVEPDGTIVAAGTSDSHYQDVELNGSLAAAEQSDLHHHNFDPSETGVATEQYNSYRHDIEPDGAMVAAGQPELCHEVDLNETSVPAEQSDLNCHDVDPSETLVAAEPSDTHHHDIDPNGSLLAAAQSDLHCHEVVPHETMLAAEQSYSLCPGGEPNEIKAATVESELNQLDNQTGVEEEQVLVGSRDDEKWCGGGIAEIENKDNVESALQTGVVQEPLATSQCCPEGLLVQSANEEQNITVDNKSHVSVVMQETAVSEAAAPDQKGWDSNQDKAVTESNDEVPEESLKEEIQIDLEKNLETAPSLEAADASPDNKEILDAPASTGHENGLLDAHVQDTVLETGVPIDLIDSSRNTSNKSSLPEKVETNEIFLSTSEHGTAVSVAKESDHESVAEVGLINVRVAMEEGNINALAPQSFKNNGDVPAETCESIKIASISDKSGNTNLETETENGYVSEDTALSCPADDASSGIENRSMRAVSEDKDGVAPDVSSGFIETADSSADVDYSTGEIRVNDSVENQDSLPTCSVDVKIALKIENSLVTTEHSSDNNDRHQSDPKDLDVPSVTTDSSYIQSEVVPDNREGQCMSLDNGEEAEDTAELQKDETSASSVEGSQIDVSDGPKASEEVVKRPFYFMMRLPRYDDDQKLKEQIRQAQFEVDEKTKIRDEIQAQIKAKRAICEQLENSLGDALSEERAARESLKAKRKEIDSIQSVINRVKSAMSVEDIDARIRNMEHMIQHETLHLKEEKNYIREIKQLKQLREQHSSYMGSQLEVQQAMDQKDQVDERLKLLKKEADSLREKLLRAEAATKEANCKLDEEDLKIPKLQAQVEAANAVRQQAYAHLLALRKQLKQKNTYFWKYKDDATVASDLAFKGDKEELQQHCLNQVERVMELWNKNDEFRKDYMRCNLRSTLRRFRTADGRSLGIDEEAAAIPKAPAALRMDNTSSVTTINKAKTAVMSVITETREDKLATKAGDKIKQTAKCDQTKHTTARTKKPGKPILTKDVERISVMDEDDVEKQVELELSKEEEELARKEAEMVKKEEELRKAKEAAMLKEQRKLEEKMKAKEAMERKKRNAEKAEARAALKAQKEAELKEKEKEKRAKKKEKKKAAAAEGETNAIGGEESVPTTETATTEQKEPEIAEKPSNVAKRTQKPTQLSKQSKAKSIPPPLRNKGKRKMQTWMWVLLIACVVCVLLLLGNSSFSVGGWVQRIGF